MKVGLSVSFCIRDMVAGKVNPADVSMIVAGTKAATPEAWEGIITRYRDIYWRDKPASCEALLREFLAANKVVQPRLETDDDRATNITNGYWMDI